jgi:DNA polymerase
MLLQLTEAATTAPVTVLQERHVLHRDYETRSPALLNKVGAHRYASNLRTEVLCVAFAVDDGPVQLWLPGQPVPPEFIEAARNPVWTVAAHNAIFEQQIERHILAPKYGFPLAPDDRHVCTMAAAMALVYQHGWTLLLMRWRRPTAKTRLVEG